MFRFLLRQLLPQARSRRVRSASDADRVLARSTAVPCPACGMLLGGVAQRRGTCPRCRTPFTIETRSADPPRRARPPRP